MVDVQVDPIMAAIQAVTTKTKENLKKKNSDGFYEVNTYLNSLIDAALNRVPEGSVS